MCHTGIKLNVFFLLRFQELALHELYISFPRLHGSFFLFLLELQLLKLLFRMNVLLEESISMALHINHTFLLKEGSALFLKSQLVQLFSVELLTFLINRSLRTKVHILKLTSKHGDHAVRWSSIWGAVGTHCHLSLLVLVVEILAIKALQCV